MSGQVDPCQPINESRACGAALAIRVIGSIMLVVIPVLRVFNRAGDSVAAFAGLGISLFVFFVLAKWDSTNRAIRMPILGRTEAYL